MSFNRGTNLGEILALPSDPYEEPVVDGTISLLSPPKIPTS